MNEMIDLSAFIFYFSSLNIEMNLAVNIKKYLFFPWFSQIRTILRTKILFIKFYSK